MIIIVNAEDLFCKMYIVMILVCIGILVGNIIARISLKLFPYPTFEEWKKKKGIND